MQSSNGHPRVSAVILTMGNRPEMLSRILDRLAEEPVDEVLVVNNGPDDAAAGQAAGRPGVRVLEAGGNTGVGGRNLGAREASGDLLLMLDDDSYPLPG